MNRGEIKTTVLQRLRIETSETARVTEIEKTINQEYLRLAARLGLNVATVGLDFTAATPTVPLPTDFVELLDGYRANSASSSVSAQAVPLQPITASQLASLQAGEASGLSATPVGPTYYVLEGQQTTSPLLRFWPTPTTTTTGLSGFVVRYKKRITKLTADSGGVAADTPLSLPEEYHDVLAELAVSVVGAEQGAWDVVDHARTRANEILQELELNIITRPGPTRSRIPLKGYTRGF